MRLRFAPEGMLCGLIAIFALGHAAPARAGLGRAFKSVEADRAALGAQTASTFRKGFTVHTLTLANSGVVKEFTRTDGVVFAVTWRGPGRPDLRQLLGEEFDTLQAEAAVRPTGRRMLRRPLAVQRPGLLIQSGGRPGAFWGAAVMTDLAPANVSTSDLK